MKIELMRAWPRRFEQVTLDVTPGARVSDALAQAGWGEDAEIAGYAIFGVRVELDTELHEGDRIELLRPLQIDPKDARRRRAKPRN